MTTKKTPTSSPTFPGLSEFTDKYILEVERERSGRFKQHKVTYELEKMKHETEIKRGILTLANLSTLKFSGEVLDFKKFDKQVEPLLDFLFDVKKYKEKDDHEDEEKMIEKIFKSYIEKNNIFLSNKCLEILYSQREKKLYGLRFFLLAEKEVLLPLQSIFMKYRKQVNSEQKQRKSKSLQLSTNSSFFKKQRAFSAIWDMMEDSSLIKTISQKRLSSPRGILKKEGSEKDLKETQTVFEKIVDTIKLRNYDLFHELLENKDLNLKGVYSANCYTLLHIAALGNDYKICEKLIQKGMHVDCLDKQERTPLLIAANSGFREITVLFLGNGAKVSHRDCYGNFPLLLAMKNHHFDLLSDLLLFGADVNFKKENGTTVLHEAMRDGDDLMLNEVLKIKGIKLNSKDQQEATPLLKGVEKCPVSVLYSFINVKGVDVTLTDSLGRNFFNLAARYGRSDIFEFFLTIDLEKLLKFSTLLSQKDIRGQTPFHVSIEYGVLLPFYYLTQLSEKCGVDINVKDANGNTPFEFAKMKIKEKEVGLIFQYMENTHHTQTKTKD